MSQIDGSDEGIAVSASLDMRRLVSAHSSSSNSKVRKKDAE